MKTKLILILLLFIIFIPTACQKQSTEWQGSISEEDGVLVVKNPIEPIYSEPLFTVEEDLVIGETEEGDEPVFLQVRGFAIDENENIYVLDMKEANIEVFNKNGEYLRTIGKKGEGPGELGLPTTILLLNQTELIVSDASNRRFSVFTKEGEFKRSIPYTMMNIGQIMIDNEGSFYGISYEPDPESPRYEVKKYDSSMESQYSLGTSPAPDPHKLELFFSLIRFHVAKDGNVRVGHPKEYSIKIFNPEGALIRRIEKDYLPIEITQAEIDEVKSEFPKKYLAERELIIPKYHGAFRAFACDEKNRLYVGTFEKTEDGKGYFYDVFDEEGKYINKLPLTIRPRIWKKGKLYALEENEEGYQLVKRYKVNWNIE